MDETATLARNAANLSFSDLPIEVVEKAKALLLDQIGCEIAFSTLPWAKAAFRYTAAKGGSGRSTVLHYNMRTNAEDAAFCNAVFGHGYEMDDTDMATTSHPAVCVVPTVFALGEQELSSGKDVLCAMVSGYETMLRFAVTADSMRLRYFHATAIAGTFGAAAAAGSLLGFDEDKMREALAIAAMQASGNTEYTQSGGTVKRLLAAFGVYSGIRSALLAKAGITGAAHAFEGNKGFARGICADEPRWEQLRIPFVDEFKILKVGNKPYCCCAAQHSVIDAAEKIRQQGFPIDSIERITILQRTREYGDVGSIKVPEDVISAQFCGRFSCALRLAKGSNGFHDYTMENVTDPTIIGLCERTDYLCDKDNMRLKTPEGPAVVTVILKDGTRVEEQVDYAFGNAKNPMGFDDITAKFRDLVSGAMSEDTAEGVIELIAGFEHLDDISPLMRLIASSEK